MRNRAIALVALLAVAVGLFIVLQDAGEDDSGNDHTTIPDSGAEAAKPAAPPFDSVRIRGGEPVGGVQTFRYESGDEIRIRVDSDTADEIHIHGYDLSKDVEAGGRADFTFPADIEGVFEIELEGSATQIAELEVSPN